MIRCSIRLSIIIWADIFITSACFNALYSRLLLYNYAEFFTAATKECDNEGFASITTGLGDMLAWASHNGKFGFAKFSADKDSIVSVVHLVLCR